MVFSSFASYSDKYVLYYTYIALIWRNMSIDARMKNYPIFYPETFKYLIFPFRKFANCVAFQYI